MTARKPKRRRPRKSDAAILAEAMTRLAIAIEALAAKPLSLTHYPSHGGAGGYVGPGFMAIGGGGGGIAFTAFSASGGNGGRA